MPDITLKSCRVTDVAFKNNLESGIQLKLENKYNYNVKYAKDICRGEIEVEISDKNIPDKFNLKAVLVGIFGFKEGVRKEILYIEIFRELFPYARAFITTLTSNAGIAPIIIPDIDIESQNIYRINKLQ